MNQLCFDCFIDLGLCEEGVTMLKNAKYVTMKAIDYALEDIVTSYNMMVRMLPDGKKILYIDDCTIILKESCSDAQEV